MTTTLVTCEIRPSGWHRGGDSAARYWLRGVVFHHRQGMKEGSRQQRGGKTNPETAVCFSFLCVEMCTRLDERLLIFLASGVKKRGRGGRRIHGTLVFGRL